MITKTTTKINYIVLNLILQILNIKKSSIYKGGNYAPNFILVGSPGCGKSMMAKRLPSILPPLSLYESLETTQIHSVAGKLHKDSTLISQRPFRAPHHTVSDVS